jgi:hypothetical protein
MRQTLVSPETTALLGALDLASRSQSLPQESRQAAGDLSRLLGELRPTMVGGSLPQPQLASLDQVKPETFQALRDNGVEIEPRMARAKELTGSNAKHEAALTGLVQQNPSMTTETVEKLWQARGAAEQAFRGIAGGHTLADQVGALKALTNAVADSVRALGLSGSDADNFRDMAMSLARSTTELGPATQHLLQTALSSDLMVEMGDALAHAAQDEGLPTTTREAAKDLHDQLGRLNVAMGLSRPSDNPPGSLDQVTREAFHALRAHGIEIDPSRL